MYSWYLVRRTAMVNNNDTVTDCFVLGEREDLLRVLATLDVHPGLTEECLLQVYREGRAASSVDLLATVDADAADDDFEPRFPDLDGVTIPALDGPVLPPGHPVLVDGEPLHYGCTTFYL
ncbi:hypothetical protein KZZ52_24400 [Dactylosporangium sp. AC04546]|uniref:hypothetical protein n=1 Tax=Dactylosporangium sp. AC04546 TaxID=2862460 RepID=UPI001EE04D78|nr:hypothetical protein [Dactylosporangium sp. AC04546]WVK88416.1 hypothetical protein KZZ52_24400 [Dactylosporangium sp. AC04546]